MAVSPLKRTVLLALAMRCSCAASLAFLLVGCANYVPTQGDLVQLMPDSAQFIKSGGTFKGLWGDVDRDALLGRIQNVTIETWNSTITNLSNAGWELLERDSQANTHTVRYHKVERPHGVERNYIRETKLVWQRDTVYIAVIARGTPLNVHYLSETEYGRWLRRVLWPKLDAAVRGEDVSP